MSVETVVQRMREFVSVGTSVRLRTTLLRVGALLGAALLLVGFVTVLAELIMVVDEPRWLLYLSAGTLLAATLFARYVRPTVALIVGFAALLGGLLFYLFAAAVGFHPLGLLADTIGLVTGMSVLRLNDVTIWLLAVTPTPVFLTWYLALRRRYDASALVGSMAVGFFVLTGDAGSTVTVLGVAGAAILVGVGDLERTEGTLRTAEYLVPVLAVMILTPFFLSVIPAGGDPVLVDSGSDPDSASGTSGLGDRTMSDAVVETGDELDVVGSIRLSVDVLFTIRADEGRYWRTGSYDRYTGDGWVETIDVSGSEEFRPAEGPTQRVDQTVRAETDVTTMPAAWRPFAIESESIDESVIDVGPTLEPAQLLAPDETYTVSSSVPNSSSEELRNAGTDYPADVEETYTQLPSDVPDRVQRGTETLVADANNSYDAAVTIERYLRTNKEYSLEVDRPEGDVADTFLFEMDAGYCTYFATTMVTMLRSQGIPSRVAVGYSTGQRIDSETWVVRGTNAHAWVEVYFPEYGWVTFEPTPPGDLVERQATELETSREFAAEFDEQAFDTVESWNVPPEGITSSEAEDSDAETDIEEEGIDEELETENETAIEPIDGDNFDGTENDAEAEGGEPGLLLRLPSTERLALIAIVAVGLVTGLRRSPVVRRAVKRARIRYQTRTDPRTDVEGAFRRMVLLVELRHRRRERDETIREYLAAVDAGPRADRIAMIRERTRYRGDVSGAMADEAVRLVDEMIHDGGSVDPPIV